jgi:hypothetical protein
MPQSSLQIDEATRRRNMRTGLVLASVAAAFFIGIVIKYVFFA